MGAEPIEPKAPEFLLEAEIGQSIASTLRSLRRDRSLTLQDVADRAGLSLAMVSKIENAQASPSLRTLAQLSQALAVPVPVFFRELSDQEDASFVAAGEGIELTRPGIALRLSLRAAGGATGIASGRAAVPRDDRARRAALSALPAHGLGVHLRARGRARRTATAPTTYALAPGDSLLLHGTVQHGPESFTTLPIRLLSITLTRSRRGDRTRKARPGRVRG